MSVTGYTYYQPRETYQVEEYHEKQLFNPFEGLDIFKYGVVSDDSLNKVDTSSIQQLGGGDTIVSKQKGTSLKKIPGIDIPLQDGRTALHISAEKGQIQATRSLLRAGAMVNVYDKQGNSPLHEASQRGFKPIVRLLLEHDAHVNVANHTGSLPIHLAAINGHEDTVRLLTGEVSGGSGQASDFDTTGQVSATTGPVSATSGPNTIPDPTLEPPPGQPGTPSASSTTSTSSTSLSGSESDDNRFETLREGEERDIMLPGQGQQAPIPGFNLGNMLDATANVPPASPGGLLGSLGKKLLSKTMSFFQPKTPF
jgi:hypothetical protein